MSQERIDRLRAAYEAFSRGEAANDLLAHDFRLHQASSVVDTAGAFEGPDAIDNRIAHVWTFRDDKAIRNVAYEEPADALKAVGLAE